MSAAIEGRPDRVRLDYHPALGKPAIRRYGATSPELLRWFKSYNADRTPRDQVKPFGFLLALSAKTEFGAERIVKGRRRRSAARKSAKPIAPFNRDWENVAASTFDRETGANVPLSALKSYTEALATYHIQPESKFLNGDYLDRGMTRRRHVRMVAARHIGKESNDWERQAMLGLNANAQPDYGISDVDRERLFADLTVLVSRVGATKAARALGTTTARLKTISAVSLPSPVAARLPTAFALVDRLHLKASADLDQLRRTVTCDGLRRTARRMGIDPSNLRRRLRQPVGEIVNPTK